MIQFHREIIYVSLTVLARKEKLSCFSGEGNTSLCEIYLKRLPVVSVDGSRCRLVASIFVYHIVHNETKAINLIAATNNRVWSLQQNEFVAIVDQFDSLPFN